MNFLGIIVEGFCAIGHPLHFDLDRGGLNVIRGKNGHAKTTLFSALLWVLYKINLKGVTASKVSTWPHKRSEAYRGTRVCVEMTLRGVNYLFVRHKDFSGKTKGRSVKNGLIIFKNGEFLATDQLHSGDYDEEVVHLLGLDSNTFLNTFLFGQGLERLSRAKDDKKRDLFDALFDAAFIEPAKEKAKKEMQVASTALVGLETEYSGRTNLIEQRKVSYQEQKSVLDNFETAKADRLAGLKTQLATKTRALFSKEEELNQTQAIVDKGPRDNKEEAEVRTQLSKARADKATLTTAHSKALDAIQEVKDEIEASKSKEAKLTTELGDVAENCGSCGQPLKEEDVIKVKKTIKDRIKKEKQARDILSKSLPTVCGKEESFRIDLDHAINLYDKLSTKLTGLTEDEDPYVKATAVLPTIKGFVTGLREDKEQLEYSIKNEESREPPANNLSTISKEIFDLELQQKNTDAEIQTKRKYVEDLDWWVKKGYGASGIKSFIFKARMGSLNEKVERYGNRLGVGIQVCMNTSGARSKFEIKCYIDGQVVDYQELSGGEKQRVDVCLAFGTHDLEEEQNPSNILVLDEIFEGLDADGIEAVFALVRMKAEEGKTVFIVTHNNTIDSMYTKTILVEKQDNGKIIIS